MMSIVPVPARRFNKARIWSVVAATAIAVVWGRRFGS